MKKIYFNIRPNSRERMWDTIYYAKELCNVILPEVKQQSSIKVYKKNKVSFVSKLKNIVANNSNLINKQAISGDLDSELLYMWGSFPKNSKKPYIVELDNPYSLTYYNIDSFYKNIEKIKEKLRLAKGITYLSEASKNHTLELLGNEFESKSNVLYPYMNTNYKNNNRDKNVINFIFVGLNLRGKGGIELLEAFNHVKNKNIKLTFISNVDEEIRDNYSEDERIIFLPPQPREKLLKEIYPQMDVFLFPTFYESFGVVLLEALSFGMGIVTTDVYATPEIVKNGMNGRLLHHPILKPSVLNNKKIINCVDLRIKEFHFRYLENGEFYFSLYNELKLSIEEAVDKYQQWQISSIDIFEEKFASKIWFNNFSGIIKN